jgi:hypothetical protein
MMKNRGEKNSTSSEISRKKSATCSEYEILILKIDINDDDKKLTIFMATELITRLARIAESDELFLPAWENFCCLAFHTLHSPLIPPHLFPLHPLPR